METCVAPFCDLIRSILFSAIEFFFRSHPFADLVVCERGALSILSPWSYLFLVRLPESLTGASKAPTEVKTLIDAAFWKLPSLGSWKIPANSLGHAKALEENQLLICPKKVIPCNSQWANGDTVRFGWFMSATTMRASLLSRSILRTLLNCGTKYARTKLIWRTELIFVGLVLSFFFFHWQPDKPIAVRKILKALIQFRRHPILFLIFFR